MFLLSFPLRNPISADQDGHTVQVPFAMRRDGAVVGHLAQQLQLLQSECVYLVEYIHCRDVDAVAFHHINQILHTTIPSSPLSLLPFPEALQTTQAGILESQDASEERAVNMYNRSQAISPIRGGDVVCSETKTSAVEHTDSREMRLNDPPHQCSHRERARRRCGFCTWDNNEPEDARRHHCCQDLRKHENARFDKHSHGDEVPLIFCRCLFP